MAWSGPSTLHAGQSSTAQTNVLTGITCAAKTLVIVVGQVRMDGPGFSITDDAGNTYATSPSGNTANFSPDRTVFIAYCLVPNALSGASITVDVGATPTTQAAKVYAWTGSKFTSIEDSGVAANKTGTATTSPTITSGAASVVDDLLICAWVGANGATYTTDGGNGWTSLAAVAATFAADYQINTGTGAKTCNPTTSSSAYAMTLLAFKVGVVTNKTVSASASSSFSMSRAITTLKTISATVANSVSIVAQKLVNKSIDVTNAATMTMTRIMAYLNTISVTEGSSFTMSVPFTKLKSVDATASSSATVEAVKQFVRSIDATVSSVMTLTYLIFYNATINVQQAYDLVIDAIFQSGGTTTDQDVNATASSSVSITPGQNLMRTISAVADSAATMIRSVTATISATGDSVASLTMFFTFAKAVDTVASSTMTMTRTVAHLLTISALAASSFTLTAGQNLLRTISAVANSVAILVAGQAFLKTISATVSAVADLTATFIAFVAKLFNSLETDIDADRTDRDDDQRL